MLFAKCVFRTTFFSSSKFFSGVGIENGKPSLSHLNLWCFCLIWFDLFFSLLLFSVFCWCCYCFWVFFSLSFYLSVNCVDIFFRLSLVTKNVDDFDNSSCCCCFVATATAVDTYTTYTIFSPLLGVFVDKFMCISVFVFVWLFVWSV